MLDLMKCFGTQNTQNNTDLLFMTRVSLMYYQLMHLFDVKKEIIVSLNLLMFTKTFSSIFKRKYYIKW